MAYEDAGWLNQDVELEGLVEEKTREFMRAMPLRRLWQGQAVRMCCGDCGLQWDESVSHLVREGRLGARTIPQVEEALSCQRKGCDGAISIEIVDQD